MPKIQDKYVDEAADLMRIEHISATCAASRISQKHQLSSDGWRAILSGLGKRGSAKKAALKQKEIKPFEPSEHRHWWQDD